MKIVLLSGVPIRSDVEAAPVGIYDVIREDVRQISTVKPVDRIFIERSKMGYRGVLYSSDCPHMFTLNGSGFASKPLQDEPAVLTYCFRLEEDERVLTAKLNASNSDDDQDSFNDAFAIGSPDEPSVTATPEVGPIEMLVPGGPLIDSEIERIPGNYIRVALQKDIIPTDVCGGGIVVNKVGKILLVKPRNGYGGYDWTFPKGFPADGEGATSITTCREVKEETGYNATVERFIGRFTHADGGTCDYYECSLDQERQGTYDQFETEDTRWVSMTEALELLNEAIDIQILSVANNLIPQIVVKGGHTGVMIALKIPPKVANKIKVKGGEPVKTMHVTIAYLGKQLSESQKKAALKMTRTIASTVNNLRITLGGVGRFSASSTSEGKDVVYLSVDSPDLHVVRTKLESMLKTAGVPIAMDHGFVPHVTLAYIDKKAKTPLERMEPIVIGTPAVFSIDSSFVRTTCRSGESTDR